MIRIKKEESIGLRSRAGGRGFVVNKVAAHKDRE